MDFRQLINIVEGMGQLPFDQPLLPLTAKNFLELCVEYRLIRYNAGDYPDYTEEECLAIIRDQLEHGEFNTQFLSDILEELGWGRASNRIEMAMFNAYFQRNVRHTIPPENIDLDTEFDDLDVEGGNDEWEQEFTHYVLENWDLWFRFFKQICGENVRRINRRNARQ